MENQEADLNRTFSDTNTKIYGLGERQRILKSRILLIGEDLIEMRKSLNKEILDIKKSLNEQTKEMKEIKRFLRDASEEFPKFARKEDLEILKKQAKMFQPLDLINPKK